MSINLHLHSGTIIRNFRLIAPKPSQSTVGHFRRPLCRQLHAATITRTKLPAAKMSREAETVRADNCGNRMAVRGLHTTLVNNGFLGGPIVNYDPSLGPSYVEKLADPDGPSYADYLVEPNTLEYGAITDLNVYTYMDPETMIYLGLGKGSTPHGWLQNTMEMFHIGFQYPWATSIVATTICAYIVTYPFRQKCIRTNQKVRALSSLTNTDMESEEAESERFEQYDLMKHYKATASHWLVKSPLYHGIMAISFYKALSQMVDKPISSLSSEGGALWLSDLTVADPTFILPGMIGATSLMAYGLTVHGLPHDRNHVNCGGVLFVGGSVAVSALCPSALGVSWLTYNSLTVVQGLVLKTSQGRKFLKIQEDPLDEPEVEAELQRLDHLSHLERVEMARRKTLPERPHRPIEQRPGRIQIDSK